MKHTYQGDQSQTIEISCEGDQERLEFVLRDCGPRCDVGSIHPRDIHDIRPGGLGTHFISAIMDEVDYGYKEGCGNVLRMVKHLNRS
jgi:anti-sigma regulatory factor (Ser/Thr protein kinase)